MGKSDAGPVLSEQQSVRRRVRKLVDDLAGYEADWVDNAHVLTPETADAGWIALRDALDAARTLRDVIGREETHE